MAATTTDAVLAFIVAAAIAWLLVPYAERLAHRLGAIDLPSERGLHEMPMPRLSGLAIFAAIEVAGWIFLPADGETRSILIGAAAIALVGVIDDVRGLPALPKLLGQVGAALIPVLGGVHPEVLTLPFVGGFELGWVTYPLTVIGIVAVVNVINFIDGIDGLAAGVCTIAAIALAVIALSLDRNAAGVLAALTAGGALGFLRHGFPPASSFMGDTGSNLLGYLLATAAVQGALKTNAVVALVLPLVVLAVPILDTGFVVAKRLKYRQPIYRADRWHFHHRMANIGFSQRRTLVYLYGWALVMAGLAMALRFIPYSDDRGDFDALWTAVVVFCGLLALAASVYLVNVLEILKLRRIRLRQLVGVRRDAGRPVPQVEEVDRAVARELETGTFPAIDPETGEFEALEPRKER
jgi:UDP-GlcNAc:undecaprenyl-phosphate/decaprenyl-phosphate GlcNAc-1-phosphate transferase